VSCKAQDRNTGSGERHIQVQATTPAKDDAVSYAYKASLIGAAHRFELTDAGLVWHLAGRTGTWPYAEIASIRLSYRPVSMQAKRFRADLRNISGRRLSLLSTSWQTASLMTAQSEPYRDFIIELHARMAEAGSQAVLTGGLGRNAYAAALALTALLGVAMTGLLIRALAIGEWAGAAFLIGFAALFTWQVGGFIRRNRPCNYSFTAVPRTLLP
jgi:hypothetical protein